MSESMVTRVAKAIYGERYEVEIAFGAMPAWEGLDSYDRQSQFDEARAAIEAMREPTEAMLDAGAEAYHEATARAIAERVRRNDEHEKAGRKRIVAEVAFPHDWLVPVFDAMVRAALEEGKQ